VCQSARTPFGGAQRGGYVCGRRVPEDKEFYECAEQEDDGELAEEQALREGESDGSALRDSRRLGSLRGFGLGEWRCGTGSCHCRRTLELPQRFGEGLGLWLNGETSSFIEVWSGH